MKRICPNIVSYWRQETVAIHRIRGERTPFLRGCSTRTADDTTGPILRSGPPLRLDTGTLAQLAHSSVVATSGDTVVLCTVTRSAEPLLDENALTVDYRQRASAVGSIPSNRLRSDSGRPSHSEILAGRALDRSLRPLLQDCHQQDATTSLYHVDIAVQATDLWDAKYGNAWAASVNAASAALYAELRRPVAATVLAVQPDHSYVQDPTRAIENESIGVLSYAGTRENTVMMEWTSVQDCLPESQWEPLLRVASACIQPLLDSIEQMQLTKENSESVLEREEDVAEQRVFLGLPPLEKVDASASNDTADSCGRSSSMEEITALSPLERYQRRQDILEHVVVHCRDKLKRSLLRLFGHTDGSSSKETRNSSRDDVHVHNTGMKLPSKQLRGRREQVMSQEIERLVVDYLECNGHLSSQAETGPEDNSNDDARQSKSTSSLLFEDIDVRWIQRKAIYQLLRHALWETTTEFGSRSDHRGGTNTGRAWKTVRPLTIQAPALPDAVHGSSLFGRGDTKVLSTVTLGAPSDGQPRVDPYLAIQDPREAPDSVPEKDSPDAKIEELPVGSLRFLRSQEALESDLNTRKVRADKERTGESVSDVKRAYLQYDFPAFSTGTVQPRRGGIDRRAIGHGSLAERAILPVLPDQEQFPYSIRMTSEVTDSNGSSSMASVCGATLALLDAGVPLKSSVAAVSVGLAISDDAAQNDDGLSKDDSDGLLLDITGTEDHYGGFDFKICGTERGVTAVQLDVKQAVPTELVLEALDLAKAGRKSLLAEMHSHCIDVYGGSAHRRFIKDTAPRVEVIRFDPQRKRDLLGPGGVVVRQLEERYGVALDLTQEGQCLLYGSNRAMVETAKLCVMDLVADVVPGETYVATVVELKDFGAILELLRNKEGLLHISEMEDTSDGQSARNHPRGNIGFVRHHLKVGDKIEVLCTSVDPVQGTAKLSRKALLNQQRDGPSASLSPITQARR